MIMLMSTFNIPFKKGNHDIILIRREIIKDILTVQETQIGSNQSIKDIIQESDTVCLIKLIVSKEELAAESPELG